MKCINQFRFTLGSLLIMFFSWSNFKAKFYLPVVLQISLNSSWNACVGPAI